MANQRDIEQLLRRVPLATPADESHASDMLQIFISLRNAAFEGAGLEIPGTTTAFSIPSIISSMREGNYADAAVTLISIAGDAAAAFSFLVTAATEAGAIVGTSALASAGVAAGMVAEAAGPAALAASVLVATFRIPSDVSENNSKLFFLSDASGILTSWMFNMPELNPHTRLMQRSRTGGYFRTDISGQCRLAHERVQQLWRSNYQTSPEARRQARQAANDSWEQYWLDIGNAIAERLHPYPTGVGTLWLRGMINEARARIRRSSSEASMREFEERQRRAAGGYWFRTSDGVELFMPDR